MATSIIKASPFIKQKDVSFDNLTVPPNSSIEVEYSTDAMINYSRPIFFIHSVSGPNSSVITMQIHGGASAGSIYIYNPTSDKTVSNLHFTLRVIYVNNSFYEIIT